ncbi:PTS sugar transporter subunit IIA [Maricaulaceae bacterium EIL42A08]|nr:PTS sugar transporter subunit IIA [Maricaulaceae bacterium EIL42A08]
MPLTNLIVPGGIVADVSVTNRKQALHALGELAHKTLDVPARPIVDALVERERLGSTGVGHGVAIPHARTDLVDEVAGFFMRLKQPVDFDGVDSRPADLVFMLLAPENAGAEHLKALAQVARLFRREDIRRSLRSAPDSAALASILFSAVDANAA